MSENWYRLAGIDELPEGTMRAFTVEGREIVVCHARDGWFALDNTCSHAYARLCEGRLRGYRLICPLHGASFDIRDGRVLGLPATTPIASHRLRIAEDQVEVTLDP